jgi:hypothetical protein
MQREESEASDDILRCHDCGIKAWSQVESDGRVVHEDFYVHNALWDGACPDDDVLRGYLPNGQEFGEGLFILCIGCFEKRLGRTLTREDFLGPPSDLFGTPPSSRFVARWETLAVDPGVR